MTESTERPKFLPSFFTAMAERAESGTVWRIFVVPVISGAIGTTVAYFIPVKFWSDDNWEISTTVYTGLLTLNGLILVLSWNAFSRIYESISAPKFCAFLRRNKLLNKYIVTISFIHGLQLLAIIASGIELISVLINVQYVLIDRGLFGFMVFSSIYAIKEAASAVAIMNDLLWQKSIFDEHHEKATDPNVVQMGSRGE